ncbi:acetyltransferase [Actinomadura sp. NBRC 104412]|uniref:GNAT family N-acetyltransferase n=1 Tax=Actinomadura sp. NBRC 104412 TaxID=3032203 RepID=UPI0024A435E7|nr:GNAT family protein [Actinomadura sp. NBRC 104412]GLZ09597.1 acetyltransferase [Actinomadura sp. NBRC 104412]
MSTAASRETMAAIEEFLACSPADFLRGLRVTLRPLTADDQDEYISLVRASEDLLRPWVALPDTPRDFRRYLERFDHSTAQALKICLNGSGAMAGTIYINGIVRGRFQCGTLAYAAFAPSAGQGYMSEGLRLTVRYAFEQLRLHRLEANIQPGNHASRKLVERQGFRLEGYASAMLFIEGAWRDHERWALNTPTPEKAHPSLPSF